MGAYIHILPSICYICFKLFTILIYFYLDGHLNDILIDFNYNYSAVFYFDTDNTFYSSGGGTNYDPIRDSFSPTNIEGGNPPTNDTFAAPDRTDTDKFADFLEPYRPRTIYSTGIKFMRYNELSEERKYFSKVAVSVRNEFPDMFNSNPSRTRITPRLIDFIRSLHKNYNLNNIR